MLSVAGVRYRTQLLSVRTAAGPELALARILLLGVLLLQHSVRLQPSAEALGMMADSWALVQLLVVSQEDLLGI